MFQALRGKAWDGEDPAVYIYISRLRRKLNDDARHPRIIKLVHGVGYMIDQSK